MVRDATSACFSPLRIYAGVLGCTMAFAFIVVYQTRFNQPALSADTDPEAEGVFFVFHSDEIVSVDPAPCRDV